uniref:Uncharacterized protein n=1 Tax=Anguilla anguilla TaxID=7936 RepID=A0A0E9P5T5_ANGAN
MAMGNGYIIVPYRTCDL